MRNPSSTETNKPVPPVEDTLVYYNGDRCPEVDIDSDKIEKLAQQISPKTVIEALKDRDRLSQLIVALTLYPAVLAGDRQRPNEIDELVISFADSELSYNVTVPPDYGGRTYTLRGTAVNALKTIYGGLSGESQLKFGSWLIKNLTQGPNSQKRGYTGYGAHQLLDEMGQRAKEGIRSKLLLPAFEDLLNRTYDQSLPAEDRLSAAEAISWIVTSTHRLIVNEIFKKNYPRFRKMTEELSETPEFRKKLTKIFSDMEFMTKLLKQPPLR